ncbi:MAG: alkaline phosphatase family protein [Acidobacteriota bacterium]|nr:alkaline phosphatase family protein [Acidobacteriota bacterium]
MKLATKAPLLLFWFGTMIAQARISQFQHIVIIVQENRTPDNFFQGLCAPPFGSALTCSPNPNSSQYDILTNYWSDKNSPGGLIQPLPVGLAGVRQTWSNAGSLPLGCSPKSISARSSVTKTFGLWPSFSEEKNIPMSRRS